jgi:hypothetical protein
MPTFYRPPRPDVLTVVGVLSLMWSGLNMLRLVLWVVVVLILGVGSWLLGPALGTIGTLFSMMIILLLIAQSILTVILFIAGLATLRGDRAGRTLHQWWAWINIVVDCLALLLTWGLSPAAWWGLVYALAILYVMGLPEVRSYFQGDQLPTAMKPNGMANEIV